MKSSFIIRETLRTINRTKFIFFTSVTLTAGGLLLSLALISGYQFSFLLEAETRQAFRFNIFLSDSITTDQITAIKNEILAYDTNAEIEYIDKSSALEKFVKETGEDITSVLDYNPIPATIIVKFNNTLTSGKSFEVLNMRLKKTVGVEDTEFEKELMLKSLSYIQNVKQYLKVFAGVIALAIFLLNLGLFGQINIYCSKVFKSIFLFKKSLTSIRLIYITYLIVASIVTLIFAALIVILINEIIIRNTPDSLVPHMVSKESLFLIAVYYVIAVMIPILLIVSRIRNKIVNQE